MKKANTALLSAVVCSAFSKSAFSLPGPFPAWATAAAVHLQQQGSSSKSACADNQNTVERCFFENFRNRPDCRLHDMTVRQRSVQ